MRRGIESIAVAAALAAGALVGLGFGDGAWAAAASTEPASETSQAAPPAPAATGGEAPRVSNVFVETFITQALQDIALQTGVNILVDNAVQGFVTLELKDVPLEKALQMILAPGGYSYVKLDDTTYLVGRGDRASPAFPMLTATERVRLNYVGAEEARRLLSEYYTPYVRFDPQTNVAVITAPLALVERIRSDLRSIDRPAPQVIIEALVTEVSDEARRQLGLEWEWLWPGSTDKQPAASFDPAQGVLNFAFLRTPYGRLVADLRAMVDSGQVRVRASPRLTVLDGQSAEIFVGEDRYIKIVTGTEQAPFTRLQAINVGVSLNLTPRVAEGGEITLNVKPTVSDVTGQVGDDLPVVSRRQLSTTVRVKDGETLVLGGLVQEHRQNVESKVPVLGDLPVVRLLFSTSRDRSTTSEVVVFITPRLLPPLP